MIPTPPPDADPQDLVRYALHCGLVALDGQQLRRLDAIALVTVQALPKDLEHGDRLLDTTMHDLRLSIAREQASRAQAWARIAAQCAGMDTDPETDQEVLDQVQTSEETDQERAIKLLRAALLLIMGPGQDGGGRGARLQRPVPTMPPSGQARPLPGAPPRRGDDIAF